MPDPFTDIPPTKPATVDDAILYQSDLGPWPTKSGGEMSVLFALDQQILERFYKVDPHELSLVPQLQLGVRAFHTSGLRAGSIGGKHFHRIKQEIIALPQGSAEFLLEDVYGNSRKVVLNEHARGLYIPPFVMHTYTVLTDASLIGVSNTLYDADNPATHDTYADETFQLLRRHYH